MEESGEHIILGTGELNLDCVMYCIFGLNIFIHISIYSNIQIYILQYNHDGIQKKVMRLIRICFPLNIKVHSLKL